jgi:hypothetical protein
MAMMKPVKKTVDGKDKNPKSYKGVKKTAAQKKALYRAGLKAADRLGFSGNSDKGTIALGDMMGKHMKYKRENGKLVPVVKTPFTKGVIKGAGKAINNYKKRPKGK